MSCVQRRERRRRTSAGGHTLSGFPPRDDDDDDVPGDTPENPILGVVVHTIIILCYTAAERRPRDIARLYIYIYIYIYIVRRVHARIVYYSARLSPLDVNPSAGGPRDGTSAAAGGLWCVCACARVCVLGHGDKPARPSSSPRYNAYAHYAILYTYIASEIVVIIIPPRRRRW